MNTKLIPWTNTKQELFSAIIRELRTECEQFTFPDEDRPRVFAALKKLSILEMLIADDLVK